MKRRFLKREPRLRTDEHMWSEVDSKVVLALGSMWLFVMVMTIMICFWSRSTEDDFNLAARAYNNLPLEERKIIADGLFSFGTMGFNSEEYVLTEQHFAPRDAEDILQYFLIALLSSSLFWTAIYGIWSIVVGFFLADMPIRFPYWLPWLVLLILCWPFLIGSYKRLQKFKRKQVGDVIDATDV